MTESSDQQQYPRFPNPGLGRREFLRRVGLTASGLLVPSFLAACGGDDDTTTGTTAADGSSSTIGDTTAPTSVTAAPSTTAAAGGPVRGGQLILATGDGMGRDFFAGSSFGPQALAHRQAVWALYQTGYNSFDLTNGLASGYSASSDGLTHTINVREGLTFHDGSPIDAQAVKDNLDAYFYADNPLRDGGVYLAVVLFWGIPSIVEAVTVVDELTVELTLTDPRADVRGALGSLYIYNPAVLRSAIDTYGTDPGALADVGSGPFRIVDFQPGEFAEYERFDGFFDEAYLDRLRIQLIPDASARFLALEGGQVDAAIGLTKADWDASVDDPGFASHVGLFDTNVFLALNTDVSEPLTKEPVRRAVAMAMNRPGYIEAFWGEGMAELGTQVTLTSVSEGFNPDVEPIPYDPEQAKVLLAEAGYGDGFSMTAIDPAAFAAVPELRALFDAIAGDLAEVGIDLSVEITDTPGWLAGSGAVDVNIVPYGNNPGVGVSVASLYFNRGPQQYSTPTTDEYRALLNEAKVSADVDLVNDNLQELMQKSMAAVAGIPLANAAAGALSRPGVHDVNMASAAIAPQHRAWVEA